MIGVVEAEGRKGHSDSMVMWRVVIVMPGEPERGRGKENRW